MIVAAGRCDCSGWKISAKEHEDYTYVCIGGWGVQGVPALAGLQLDVHISLERLPVGVAVQPVVDAMNCRLKRMEEKVHTKHMEGVFRESPFSLENYCILDLLVTSPLHQALWNITHAGLSAQSKQVMPHRKNFHLSIRQWPRPPTPTTT